MLDGETEAMSQVEVVKAHNVVSELTECCQTSQNVVPERTECCQSSRNVVQCGAVLIIKLRHLHKFGKYIHTINSCMQKYIRGKVRTRVEELVTSAELFGSTEIVRFGWIS